jgi:hypothetical protein
MSSDLELQPWSEADRFVTVYATGRILRFNMALDALRQAQVPVQTQEQSSTGPAYSMPVVPTLGPGVFWSLLVPEKALGEAERVLAELPFPITTNPGFWDLLPDSETPEARADTRAAKRILAVGFLAFSLLIIAAGATSLAHGDNRGQAISLIGIGLVLGGITIGLAWHSRRWSERHKASNESHRQVRAHRRRG